MIDIGWSAEGAGWLVVWTLPRAEKRVASRIAARAVPVWMPSVTERHRWSDRWRTVVLPLFPRYLFVRCDPAQLHTILRTQGVLTVVKAGEKPARLSDGYVASLRRAIESPDVVVESVAKENSYSIDDEIVVQEGPLAGFRGVVQQLRGAQQLVIWIEAIGRGVAFTVRSALVAHPMTGSVGYAQTTR